MICLYHPKRTPLTLTAGLVVALVVAGCARVPAIYTMQPEALEAIRSEISTIGVTMSPELPETEVMLPAKGVWGGLQRGVVVGATLPVMIGFVSPVPGGTFLGVVVSPFGAVIGGVVGISTAVPTDEVEHAEVMLSIAAENVRQQGLREHFIAAVIDTGNATTELTFVAWQEGRAPTPSHDIAQLPYPPKEPIDAQLKIQVEKVGLHGVYRIDPPTDTFIQIHVQLVRLRDEAVLFDERFTCASDEERSFKDWADQAGIDMIDEFRACVPELAEKIADDFFRVYPIKWGANVHD